MKTSLTRRRVNKHILATGAASLIAGLIAAHGQAISITGPTTYLQNFDTLVTGNWTDNSTIVGWQADSMTTFPATGIPATLPLAVFTAGVTAPARGFFNAGVGGERALAWSPTTTTYGATAMGVVFQNNSGVALTLGAFSYNGELYATKDAANALDGFQFSYQIGTTAVTNLALGGVAHTNANAYAANAALVDTGWTPLSAFDYATSNASATAVTLANAIVTPITGTLGLALAPGQFITLRWRNFNDAGADAVMGIDDVSLAFTAIPDSTYDLLHTVGTAPDGALDASGAQYWLAGGNPSAYLGGVAAFSQNPAGTANISVPANISVGSLKVDNTSGTYSFGGAGLISGPLNKSNAGTLALTSANSFSSVALSGGKIQVSAAGALGTGVITLSGTGGTLENAADYTLNNVVAGTGALTKLGAGTLTVGGVNTHAATTISAGNAILTGSLPNNHALTTSSGTSLRVTGTVGTGATTTIAGRVFGTGTVNGTTTISNGGIVESGVAGVGNLAFQNLHFGVSTFNASLSSSITVSGLNGLMLNGGAGGLTINIAGNPVVGTTYSLINYDGVIGGAGFPGGVTLGTVPNRIVATLSDNTTTTTLEYTVTGTDFPVWSGALNGLWALGLQGGTENWVQNSNAALTDFRLSDNVMFNDAPATDQTVTINGADVVPASVTFNNSVRNYTFAGTNGITGNAAVIKSGTATVTISNTNSFAGAVSVHGGTLRADSLANAGTNSALGSGTTINLDGGGTLEYSGVGPAATNRPIAVNNVIGGGGGTIRTTDTLTLSGAISGAGTFTKAGTGRVIINSAVSGPTTVSQGVLELGAGANVTGVVTVGAGATLEVGTGAIGLGAIIDNGIVTISRSDTATFNSDISGIGELIMNGTGTVTLGGAAVPNTFTGLTRVLQGVLIAGKTAGTDVFRGDLLIDGGSFRLGASNQLVNTSNITLSSGSFGDVLNAAPTANITDQVNNVTVNGGTFGSHRSGTATPFQIDGTLAVGAAGTVLFQRGGAISANTVTAADGAVFNFDGGSTTGATAAAVQDSRLIIGAGGLTVTNGKFNFNVGPSGFTLPTSLITGSRGSRIQVNGTFTSIGTTNILRSTTANLGTFGQARSAIELNSGVRTFDVTGTLNFGTLAAPLSVRDGNPALVVADPIPAAGGLIKAGTGLLYMPGDQPYTGTTTINGGTLAIDGNLSTSSVTINSGGTLSGRGITGTTVGGVTVNNGGAITPGVAGVGTLTFPTLTLGAGAADTSTLTFQRGVTSSTIVVSGTDGLMINSGAGTVTVNLAGTNPGIGSYALIDYAGVLGGTGESAFVRGTMPNRVGTVRFTNDAVNTTILLNIDSADVPIWTGKASSEWSTATIAAPKNWGIVGSATLTDYLEQDNVLFDDTAITTALTISAGDIAPSIMRFNNSTKDYTVAGPNLITGAASFVKDGTGTVSVSGANTFTGSVTLNAGTTSVDMVANVGVGQPLGAGALLTFNGGTLQYTGFSESTDRAITLAGAGTVKTDNNLTLAGLITGAGRLTKTGFGNVALSAANVGFNGGLTIKEGSVQFAAINGAGGDTQIVTLDGGTLDYTGTAGINWTDATALQTRGIAVASFGTIRTLGVVGAGLNLTRAGSITGAGQLTKDGVGTLRITADNVGYTGNWSVNNGGLEVQSVNALGSGTVTVETGGILVKQQTATVGAGTTLPNNITLNGGRLTVRTGNFGAFGGSVNVTAPSNVSLSSFTSGGSLDVTISGPLSGNQPLTVVGAAAGTRALILTNPASNYAGQYIVTATQGLTAQPPITGNPLGIASISLDSAARLGLHDDGTGNNGTVVYGNNLTITGAAASTIDVNRSGATATSTGNTIQLGTLTTTSPTLNVTGGNGYFVEFLGNSDLGLSPTINATTGNISFEGDVTAGGLIKTGAGIVQFDEPGTVTIPGLVDIQAGTLSVNSILNSNFDVSVSGTLSGSGTITNNVVTTATGIIAPGNSAGILDIGGNITLVAGSSFNVELAHGAGLTPIAGTDYDQLNVGTVAADGTVDITGSTLNINAGVGSGFIANDLFFIIVNDGIDPVLGTFANAPTNGSFLTASGVTFEISYDANFGAGTLHGGNDVALIVPEPGSAALLLGGLALLASRRRRKG